VFENRVLRRIFGSKRHEVIGAEENCTVEFHYFYSLPNIIRMIKSRMMRWTGNVACMREMRNA
jgi:hypothetical protein